MGRFTKDTARAFGSRGGTKTQASHVCTTRFSSESARAAGQLGGSETIKRHGKAHMAAIGAAGFRSTVERHWNGDAAHYLDYLHEHGLLANCDRDMTAMLEIYREHRPDLFD